MPANLGIGFFVLGSVLILIALVGGKFKFFIAEVSPTVTSPFLRLVAFALGLVFILLSLNPAIMSTALAESTSTPAFVPTASVPALPQSTQTSVMPEPINLHPTDLVDTLTPQIPDPTDFVVSYWRKVSEGRYETAWEQLSSRFRQAMHNNNYNDYVRGYEDLQICDIVISNVILVYQDLSSAVVTAHLTYYTAAECNSSEHNFEMSLIYNKVSNSWLFDKNVVRE